MAVKGFRRPEIPVIRGLGDVQNWIARHIDWLFRQPMAGKWNAVGTVTFTANAATTTYNDPRIGGESYIGLMPTTANAAADVGSATSIWITARGDGTCTINHPNNANVDKTFITVIVG